MCGVSNSNSNRNSHCRRRHHHHHHRHHNNGNIMINIFLLLFSLRILFDAQQIDSICFTLILLPETVTTHEKSGIKGQIYGVLIWLIHISKRKKKRMKSINKFTIELLSVFTLQLFFCFSLPVCRFRIKFDNFSCWNVDLESCMNTTTQFNSTHDKLAYVFIFSKWAAFYSGRNLNVNVWIWCDRCTIQFHT